MMTTKRAARLAAYLIIASLAAWAAYLVIVGVSFVSYAEVQPGEPLGPGQIGRIPYWPALYSPLALILVIVGILKDRWLPLAWTGLVAHLILGILLIFGPGILNIAATGLLAVPVAILQWQTSRQVRWLVVAWIGDGLVLLVGVLMLGTVYGFPLLAAGMLVGIVLLVVGRRRTE